MNFLLLEFISLGRDHLKRGNMNETSSFKKGSWSRRIKDKWSMVPYAYYFSVMIPQDWYSKRMITAHWTRRYLSAKWKSENLFCKFFTGIKSAAASNLAMGKGIVSPSLWLNVNVIQMLVITYDLGIVLSQDNCWLIESV